MQEDPDLFSKDAVCLLGLWEGGGNEAFIKQGVDSEEGMAQKTNLYLAYSKCSVKDC